MTPSPDVVFPETPELPDAAARATYLTTGHAARWCAVDPRTMARWADAGLLPSHRTGGGRRRILRADLLSFMHTRGMPVPPSALRGGRSSAPRVAVIDDEPRIVRALARLIARLAPGADVRSAHDGFSAGTLLASFPADVVFLDVIMPGMSGIDVCAHIRSSPGLVGCTVAIVSGHLNSEVRARLADVGVDAFIAKPFGKTEIASVLGTWRSARGVAAVEGGELEGDAVSM